MNILFITADQWRGDCLSAIGHAQVRTPHLDDLAAEGVLFKQHYAQATPCSPSRTSIHTGMYLQNHRCVKNGTPVDSRFSNWALEVRAAGFDPSLFGYTDTAKDPRGLSSSDPRLKHYSEPLPGIGSFTPYQFDVSMDWVYSLQRKGYKLPPKLWDLYALKSSGVDWADGGELPLPLAIKTEDHETFFMVNECIDWIKGQRKPWVTHLSLLRPHPPFAVPQPYNVYYDPASMPVAERGDDSAAESQQHPFLKYCIEKSAYRAPDSDHLIQQHKANYYGLISEVDDNLGRLFALLKESGDWDSTLIIFTSDHGEQMGDHWLSGKLGYFDQSYHIPLIVRDPRPVAEASRGKQYDVFTENVDIMPTMLDWLELDIPTQCDGRSLLPIIENASIPHSWRSEVHWEYDFRSVLDDSVETYLGISKHQCALSVIRDRRYKYVHFTALPALFFDLENDPGEYTNQAENPLYQGRVLEYAQKMLGWKMNHAERGFTETLLGEAGPQTLRAELY